MYIIISEKLN